MQPDIAGRFFDIFLAKAELKISKHFNLQYRTLDIWQGGIFDEIKLNVTWKYVTMQLLFFVNRTLVEILGQVFWNFIYLLKKL